MPIYECLTRTGTLDPDKRQRVADAVTSIHVDETGAPKEFVNVYFPELPEGRVFTAGEVSAMAVIRGQIRAGRPMEVRHNIMHRIADAYVEITSADPLHVMVVAMDVPSAWIMEGGQIAPEPTLEAEKAWFEQQAAANPA